MADVVDQAAEKDFSEEALLRARSTVQKPVPRGKCLNCGEQLASHMIYCDEHCKYDYERRTNA